MSCHIGLLHITKNILKYFEDVTKLLTFYTGCVNNNMCIQVILLHMI